MLVEIFSRNVYKLFKQLLRFIIDIRKRETLTDVQFKQYLMQAKLFRINKNIYIYIVNAWVQSNTYDWQ